MATYEIQAPNGKVYRIEGPEGASDEDVRAEVMRQFPESAGEASSDDEGLSGSVTYEGPNPANQALAGPLALLNPGAAAVAAATDPNFVQGVAEGGAKVFNNAARAMETGAEWLGLDDAFEGAGEALGMARDVEAAEANQNDFFDSTGFEGSPTGRMVGEMAATLPVAMLPGGVMTQGAAAGALVTDERDLLGIAKDAAIGAAGGKAGELAIRGAARGLSPVLGQDAQLLAAEGVRLTPGQSVRTHTRGGRAVARQEDKMTSHPFVGDMIDAGRRESVETFNTAAINRALSPINQKLPEGMVAGRRAIRHAGDRLGDAYDEVLPQIGPFELDADELVGIQELAGDMLPERARQLNNILGGLGRYFREGVTLDGAALKEIETRLSEKIRKFSVSPDADQQQLGEALDAARSAIREAAARAHPDLAADLRAINQGWASLVQVERAALNGKGGVFSPNSYSNAVRATDASTRRRGYARGSALNQDLADAASEVLPSEIADSGTGARWATANVPALALGALETIPYRLAQKLMTGPITPSLTRELTALQLRKAAPYSAIPTTAVIEALRNAGP